MNLKQFLIFSDLASNYKRLAFFVKWASEAGYLGKQKWGLSY